MLIFQSLSAGACAVLVCMGGLMTLVGVYVILVWPLTFWDLTNVGLEKYGAWSDTALWSVFAGGSMAGFWCFSGAAFRSGKAPRSQTAPLPERDLSRR